MGVPRNEHCAVLLPKAGQGSLKQSHFPAQIQDLVPHPEPQIEGHLIVARTPRCEPCPGRNTPRQRRLDVHVDVLQRRIPPEFARS